MFRFDAAKPPFSFEYEFQKHEMQTIAEIFGRPMWEVEDAVTSWVRTFDQSISSMHEGQRRSTHYDGGSGGLNSDRQAYGNYLGCHSLYLASGALLNQHPVHKRWSDENAWSEWFHRQLLTRSDGIWIADGTGEPPMETRVNLREKGRTSVHLTSKKEKVLQLIGAASRLQSKLVIDGTWSSADGIDVDISSALVTNGKALSIVKKLATTDPFQVWLPTREDYADGSEDRERSNLSGVRAWVVRPSRTGRLDEADELGATSVVARRRLVSDFLKLYSLSPVGPFSSSWTTPNEKAVIWSDAWGRNSRRSREASRGVRLSCGTAFLKRVLRDMNADLLILITLRDYKQGHGTTPSHWFHTTALIRVQPNLRYSYIPGAKNKLRTLR